MRHRPEGTVNPEMPTGVVEVAGIQDSEVILNEAQTRTPFQLDDQHVHDDTRLRYRYVDLRTDRMRENTCACARKRRPRTARLPGRPARISRDRDPDADQGHARKARATTWCRAAPTPGRFFALPQSPQLFKQLY